MTDVHRLLGSLQKQGAALHLDTSDLCFLVALHARAEAGNLASLDEDLLYDVFEQVCTVTDPGAANPRKRATHAVHRMREQRLLGRVDGAGLVRSGEYALTRLGTAIVEFFLAEDGLTRESLALLTRVLASQLSEVRNRALAARGPEDWRAVVQTLRVVVRDLVAGIERRQRGLDAQQEEVRSRIGDLLQRDWFGAVDACEELLADTSATLRELNEVLLQDAALLQALLQEIEGRAAEAGAGEAEDAARQVSEQVDRVSAWGGERLRAWSEYFQFVQRYLRGVVRLDPQRAVSQRLRDLLAGWTARPWYLNVAEPVHLHLLREPDVRPLRPAVARPRQDREAEPAVVAPDLEPATLEARVREALGDGAATLAEVVDRVLPGVDPSRRYGSVGRVAEQVARESRVSSARERDWVQVQRLQLEDWSLTR